MAITDKRGINITSGFKLISPTPIDARFVVENEEELQSIIENGATYDGLEVWVKSLNSKVRYNGEKFVSTSDLGIEKVEREKEVVDESLFKDTVVPTNEGTKVPNSGTIEKVYFNTKLSIDEVKALIDSLTFSWSDSDYMKVYVVVSNDPVNAFSIMIGKQRSDTSEEFTYFISLNDNSGSGSEETRCWSNKEGWLLDNIAFSGTLVSEYNGIPIGNQNDKLTSVMSSTPFEKIERNYIYKGGTTVPNSGVVEKVYFNIDLSVEEVVAFIDSLNYSFDTEAIKTYYVAAQLKENGNAAAYFLSIAKMQNENCVWQYAIVLNDNTVSEVVTSETVWTNNEGWKMESATLNYTLTNTIAGEQIGHDNEKIRELISLTPFGKVLKEDLEIVEGGWKTTPVPNTGHVEKVYFNTNLSVQEVINILIDNYAEDKTSTSTFGKFLLYHMANPPYTGNGDINVLAAAVPATKQGSILLTQKEQTLCIFSTNSSPSEGIDFIGWNPNFDGVVEVNGEIYDKVGSNIVGEPDDKLMSITPFEGIKGGQIKHETIQLHPISKETGELDPNTKLFPRVKVSDLRTEGNQKYHIPNVTFGKREIATGEEKWVGTTVPNRGHVENIYFNTSLSNDEVVEILSKLEPSLVLGNISGYTLWIKDTTNNTYQAAGMVMWHENDGVSIYYNTQGSSTYIPIFNTSQATANEQNCTTDGWQEFENPVVIDLSLKNATPNGFPVGEQNDKLSSLMSTTEIVKKPSDLIVEQGLFHINRDGTPNFEKPVYLKYDISSAKSPVPNSGYVEKIKFDTSLSIEEVENIVNGLDNWLDMDGIPAKFIVYNETARVMIALAKVPGIGCGILAVTEAGEVPIFSSSLELSQEFGYDAIGWHEGFTGEIECNCEVSDMPDFSSFVDNESLVDIVFVGSGGNGLALKLDDINSKQKGKKITSIIYNGVSYAIGEENSIGFEEVD